MSTEHLDGRKVDVSIDIEAAAKDVFRAFTEPDKLSGWFVDRAEGKAEPGEVMTWIFDKFDMKMKYKVLEVVPGEKVVFGPGDESTPPFLLEIRIKQHKGDTSVRLINSGFSDDADFDAQFEGIDSGWRMGLGLLKEYVENNFAKPKRGFMAMVPTTPDFDDALDWFTRPELLEQWLGTGQVSRKVGGEAKLDLKDDDRIQGRVLAVTDKEVAFSWPSESAALELKAWTAGPNLMLGIRGTGWEMTEERCAQLEGRMQQALDRLVGAATAAT